MVNTFLFSFFSPELSPSVLHNHLFNENLKFQNLPMINNRSSIYDEY